MLRKVRFCANFAIAMAVPLYIFHSLLGRGKPQASKLHKMDYPEGQSSLPLFHHPLLQLQSQSGPQKYVSLGRDKVQNARHVLETIGQYRLVPQEDISRANFILLWNYPRKDYGQLFRLMKENMGIPPFKQFNQIPGFEKV